MQATALINKYLSGREALIVTSRFLSGLAWPEIAIAVPAFRQAVGIRQEHLHDRPVAEAPSTIPHPLEWIRRHGGKEEAVGHRHLRPGGKTEQGQGQICKQLAHIGYKNMYFL